MKKRNIKINIYSNEAEKKLLEEKFSEGMILKLILILNIEKITMFS